MLTIDAAPLPATRTAERDARWRAMFGDVHLGDFRQPFFQGARELLAKGHDPAELLQMRHANGVIGLTAKLGEAAKWSAGDRKTTFERWMPFSRPDVSPKSGLEASAGTPMPPEGSEATE